MMDKLILDKIYAALISMRDARDMLRELSKKKEKDFIDDSPIKEAVEHAMGELTKSMGYISPLGDSLNRCIHTLAMELLSIDGVSLDFEGAKIELVQIPNYSAIQMPQIRPR